jgi:hypothetical protein
LAVFAADPLSTIYKRAAGDLAAFDIDRLESIYKYSTTRAGERRSRSILFISHTERELLIYKKFPPGPTRY